LGVAGALGRLGLTLRIVVVYFIVMVGFGVVLGLLPQWQLNLPRGLELNQVGDDIGAVAGAVFGPNPILSIVWQNGRILLGAWLLAMFSFGVGALILTPLAYVILGYLFTQVLAAGYNPTFLLAAVIPHGLVEIPVIVLATAAAVRLGAVITRPPRGTTVGQAWTLALTDSIKIGIGLVLPGLVIGAVIEAYITPAIVAAVLTP
jgi:stage II sporulation protein M